MPTRVSDLAAVTSLADADEFYVVAGGNSRKIAYDDLLAALPIIGVAQTWTDLTASRAVATSYQNTTGKPIMVSVEPSGATPGEFQVSVDNISWVRLGTIILTGSDVRQGAWIVPNGNYYRLSAGSFSGWRELR